MRSAGNHWGGLFARGRTLDERPHLPQANGGRIGTLIWRMLGVPVTKQQSVAQLCAVAQTYDFARREVKSGSWISA